MRLKRGVFITLILLFASASSFGGTVTLSAEEYMFSKMINVFRGKLGLPLLTFHTSLQQTARSHSQWMASTEIFSHNGPESWRTSFDRIANSGFGNYTWAGENIACGYADAFSTFVQWVESPSHLANMVSPHFRYMGVAREGNAAQKCSYYWTNDFGSLSDPDLDSDLPIDPLTLQSAINSALAVPQL